MKTSRIEGRVYLEFTLSEYKNIAYALAAAISSKVLSAWQKKNLLTIYHTLIEYNNNLYEETFSIFLETLETLQIVLPSYKMNAKNPAWGQRYVIPRKNDTNNEHEKKMKLRHRSILKHWEQAKDKYNLSEEEVKMTLTPDIGTIQKLVDDNRRLTQNVLELILDIKSVRAELNDIKEQLDLVYNQGREEGILPPLHVTEIPRTYPGNSGIILAVDNE